MNEFIEAVIKDPFETLFPFVVVAVVLYLGLSEYVKIFKNIFNKYVFNKNISTDDVKVTAIKIETSSGATFSIDPIKENNLLTLPLSAIIADIESKEIVNTKANNKQSGVAYIDYLIGVTIMVSVLACVFAVIYLSITNPGEPIPATLKEITFGVIGVLVGMKSEHYRKNTNTVPYKRELNNTKLKGSEPFN